MIWFKKNKINVLKKNFPELKNINIKGNDIKCITNNGIIDNRAVDGIWCSQFISQDRKIISTPETSKSLVNVIRKLLCVSKEYAHYGYLPVSKADN